MQTYTALKANIIKSFIFSISTISFSMLVTSLLTVSVVNLFTPIVESWHTVLASTSLLAVIAPAIIIFNEMLRATGKRYKEQWFVPILALVSLFAVGYACTSLLLEALDTTKVLPAVVVVGTIIMMSVNHLLSLIEGMRTLIELVTA